MRKIVSIGETVLDIIFDQNNPIVARAGGSVLNSSVSLGRTGIPVQFISELGRDRTADIVIQFLQNNGVSTDYMHCHENGKTSIALAFLDSEKNASYTFYKDYPVERILSKIPALKKDDILLFGSYYAVMGAIRPGMLSLLKKAREQQAITIYDPNFRKPHAGELDELRPYIIENISHADIIRGSSEDFLFIFGAGTVEKAFEIVYQYGCNNLIYTQGKDKVIGLTPKYRIEIPVPVKKLISTIGAGDAFNAGIIFYLMKNGILSESVRNLKEADLKGMAEMGIRFSGDVCLSYDNYISLSFAKNLKEC